jgi:hypothetical protein
MSHRLYRFAVSYRSLAVAVPEAAIEITDPSTNSVFQTTSKKGGVNEV